MNRRSGWSSCIFVLSSFLLLSISIDAISFDLHARHSPKSKCIWHYAMTDTLVVISTNIEKGENQRIDLEIVDGSTHRNVYQSKKDINGETRIAITTHSDADLGVCFTNHLDSNVHLAHPPQKRSVDLDIDIGADAVVYNAIAKAESLSGLEVEMRKLEGIVHEIVQELNYLKLREAKMRDTNESTNSRVKNFTILTVTVLISSGVWQIWYLRKFFRSKHLIE
ncbi:endoplasmic reticulum vesicle protein 25 [Phakopsora pachyrhizi]|nr:endoplasmic reticulum vesicle protein 25 [Phakopsora pachyrhizi]